MAMILITHDLGVVAGRTDEIAVMYAGRIVEHAPTRTLFTEMRHPYTQALIRSIPKLSDPSHTRLEAIPGRPPTVIDPPPGCAFAARCTHSRPRCLAETPLLLSDSSVGPGHRHACFYPVGTAAGDAALAENAAAGYAAGGLSVTTREAI